jgi:hypothetical protein
MNGRSKRVLPAPQRLGIVERGACRAQRLSVAKRAAQCLGDSVGGGVTEDSIAVFPCEPCCRTLLRTRA